MQRLTKSLRCVLHRRLYCRARHAPRIWCPYQASPLCSSSSDGRDHDDFWTSVKAEAESTPAFRKAVSVATPTAGTISAEWATPGVDATKSVRPAGQAYQPYNDEPRPVSGDPYQKQPYTPLFDMTSPMHLSPAKLVTVSSFSGALLVDIRQYFKNPEGATLPMKKGVSLTIPQWRRLKEAINDIDRKIAQSVEDASGTSSPRRHDDGDGHGGGPA